MSQILGPPLHPAVPRPAGAGVRREVGGRRSDPRDAAGAGPTWTTRGEHGSTYNYQLTGSIVSDSDQQRAVPAGQRLLRSLLASASSRVRDCGYLITVYIVLISHWLINMISC